MTCPVNGCQNASLRLAWPDWFKRLVQDWEGFSNLPGDRCAAHRAALVRMLSAAEAPA